MARRGSPCRAPEEPGGPWRRLRGTSLPFSDGPTIYIYSHGGGGLPREPLEPVALCGHLHVIHSNLHLVALARGTHGHGPSM
jgi:hypothetical protein